MHVLVLLELLSSKWFYYILIQPIFRSHISLVVINKCYLVANQGKSFQLYYIQLFKVQLLLNLIVPWFTYTAIFDEEIYTKVIKLARFYQSTTDLKQIDINRPDLFIIRGYIKRRDKNNYKILFFIIKKAFKEAAVEENYIFVIFGQIFVGSSKISILFS